MKKCHLIVAEVLGSNYGTVSLMKYFICLSSCGGGSLAPTVACPHYGSDRVREQVE